MCRTTATPLHLVANQPATRLHSQFDFGGHSDAEKHRGREVMRMHPDDAAARGIADGDIVRLFNARGACLAAADVTDDIRAGVVQLPTGAWYDPEDADEDNPLCVHGNPNVLTRDVGTSSLAQGCTRAADDGAGRALRRQPAADQGVRSAASRDHGADKMMNRSLPRLQNLGGITMT